MKKQLSKGICVILLFLLTSNSHAQFFYDGFESGDMSTTNSDGFSWSNNNGTSIVTMDSQDGPVAVWSNGSIYNVSSDITKDWTAKNGDYSMKFRYAIKKVWTEQRFKIGKACPEIWMSFWLRVPTNYTHPKVEGASDNQKLFTLWMDGYSSKGEGSTVGMEFRGDKKGGSYFYGKISPGNYNGSGGDKGGVPFISVPNDRGKWMHLVVHVNSESSLGQKDGLMEVWRKWEGDTNYTKTHDFKDQGIRQASSVKGFAEGYLMGWANAEYQVETEFLLDDFTLSTTSLLNTGSTSIKNFSETEMKIYPNPTRETLTIEGLRGEEVSFNMKNTLGEEVFIKREQSNGKVKVNTKHLPTGVYFLTIIYNNQKSVHKIIKN